MLAGIVRAIEKGHVQALEKLISEQDPGFFVVDADGRTALHFAAGKGDIRMFKAIATAFPDLMQKEDFDGWIPLDLAAKRGCLAVVLFQFEREKEMLNNKIFFACVRCGLCKVGRDRFEKIPCKKDASYKHSGPRRVIASSFDEARRKLSHAEANCGVTHWWSQKKTKTKRNETSSSSSSSSSSSD